MTAVNGFPVMNTPVRVKLSLRESFAASWNEKSILLFSAPCGFGKTSAASVLLADKNVAYLSAREQVTIAQINAAADADCLVLDDAQDLMDESIQNAVISFVRSNPKAKLVVLSRGPVPSWLSAFRLRGMMKVFGTSDLVLDSIAAAHLFQDFDVSIPASSLALIMEETLGYPLAICSCIRKMGDGVQYSPAMSESIAQELYDYFDTEIFRRFSPAVRDLLMRASLFDTIDPRMIEAISDDANALVYLEQLRATTSMTFRSAAGVRFWSIWLSFLSQKRAQAFSSSEICDMYDRAGDFYRESANVADALSCYEKAGRSDKVRQLLIDNARLNVVKGSYYGAQSYYCRLTEEEIENSPLLIQGMSVISALQLRYSDSDYWQDKLLVFADDSQNTDIRRREARVRYSYADLTLPQRGCHNARKRLAAAAKSLEKEKIERLQYSLTSARDGVVNGLHDFSLLLEEEGPEGITSLKPLIEEVFGPEGVHFVDCLPIEYRFLRGEVSEHDIMELTKALTRIRRDRLPEMELSVASLIARIEMSRGESKNAIELLEGLRSEFSSSDDTRRLVPSVNAMLVFCQIQLGLEAEVARWLADDAPDDLVRPHQTDIFSYFAMAMGLAYTGEYRRALATICLFDEYLRTCGRSLDLIFSQTLSAVCLRQLDEDWQSQMAEALEIAAKYGYVQPFAQFADAVIPMVRNSGANVPAAFLEKVEDVAVKQTLRYPKFVKNATVLEKPLTDTEQRVLELICNDMNNAQICEILDIKLPTVKTHVSHVFAKLGCKRRADARAAAARLGLV